MGGGAGGCCLGGRAPHTPPRLATTSCDARVCHCVVTARHYAALTTRCSWSDVTIERARAVHRAFSQKQWSFERLYIGWYQRQMYERRLGRIKGKRIHYRSLTAPQQQQQETKEAQQQQPARR